jgi:cardiolipin synthase
MQTSPRRRSRPSLKKVIARGLGGLVLAQTAVLAVVGMIAAQKRKAQPQGFPHADLPPAQVGENHLQLYSHGRELFDAMFAAIDAAQESVYLETFILKDDAVGRDFKEHLARKAQQGVDVYLIFDSFGNLVVPRAFKAFPPEIHVLEYRPIRRPWHLLDPRRYALDHRKLLVVDGRVAFVGGFNLGSLYATAWRDTHLRVEGPAAADLAHEFTAFWNDHRPAGAFITRHYPRQLDPHITLESNDALRLLFPIRDAYIAAIARAEHHILLTNAYFVPDRILLRALIDAARRGVKVEVLLPWISNHTLPDWLARGLFTRCLEAGIRIFGYQTMLHAKTCTIDGQWSTIGTANLDRLSAVGNYEVNVVVYSPDLARQMEDLFARDKQYARELSLEEWRARPWYARASERLLFGLRVFA